MMKVGKYNQICDYINNHKGLPVECYYDLCKQYGDINKRTLGSIVTKQWLLTVKRKYSYVVENASRFLIEYENEVQRCYNDKIIVNMAIREKFPPIGLCRILLSEKYNYTKPKIAQMLKSTELIPDIDFRQNINICLYNDLMDGELSDVIRKTCGFEYEQKLKNIIDEMGLHYQDEDDLRNTGHDKTPDIKLTIPFLYKGEPIHWIESKANFGDLDSHKRNVKDQLASYKNRFNGGIIIYWFGYVDKILHCKENLPGIHILSSFPDKNEIKILKIND